MQIPFSELPFHARVWIYQSDRVFTQEELTKIEAASQGFLTQWTAHGSELKAGVDFRYDRFIILGLNESIQSASGCSIDASVRFIQSIEEEFSVMLMDKMNVTYRNKEHIQYIPLKDFRKMAKKKQIPSSAIVFNNLVLDKGEYETQWEVPASSSWHSRYF
tara:strand:+ start:310 stop:792 length:483 start_codon:yes stop_codon:yes gene_type:complete